MTLAGGTAILWPLFAMAALTIGVIFRLGRMRFAAVRAQRVDPRFFRAYRGFDEPEDIAVASRHVINLFETPVLFYVAGIMIYVTGQTSWALVLLAWAFVAIRCAHAFVHLTSNRVRVRFRIFAVGLLVLATLWVVFGVQLALA